MFHRSSASPARHPCYICGACSHSHAVIPQLRANIGTDEEISILDRARIMIEVARSVSKIRTSQRIRLRQQLRRRKRRVPDVTPMREILGVVREITLRNEAQAIDLLGFFITGAWHCNRCCNRESLSDQMTVLKPADGTRII